MAEESNPYMDSLINRLNLKYLGARLKEDWPALLILAMLLLVSTGAIVVAGWAEGLWILPTLAMIGLVIGYLLAISVFSEFSMVVMGGIYALFTVWALVANNFMPDEFTFRQSLMEVATRFVLWAERALEGGFSSDNLIFVVTLGMVIWLLAFNAATNLFRSRRLWYAVIPPGIALLINTYYYYGPSRMDLFLIGYLFLSFTLAVRTNAVMRERLWRRRRVGYTPGIRFDFLRAGMIAVVLVIALAWSAPAASASNKLSAAWDRSVNPWHRMQDTMQRLFGGVRGGSAVTADYYGGPTLNMGGPINLSNAIVMYVYAPEGYHYYWRSKVFDTYNPDSNWASSSDARESSDFGILGSDQEGVYELRRNVQQRFSLAIRASRFVYAAPQPVSFASLPVNYDVVYTQPGTQDYVDVVQVRSQDLLTAGTSYTATSSLSYADESSLRMAGVEYPDWVRERYLQLPETISQRTVDLATSIAAPYDNPYDKARAIETYLRENISYSQSVESVPAGQEKVDYFLFESQEGYCTYYASAMVVMLRSQGIPARIAVGFAQGSYDDELRAYRVAESDAHSWVEAYFPTYGWIEFEPTSTIEAITRQATRPNTEGMAFPEREFPQLEEELEQDPLFPGQNFETDPPPSGFPAMLEAVRNFRVPAAVWWTFGLIALLAAGLAGVWFYFEFRGMTGLSEVSRSYARLNTYAPWMGLRLEPSATPYERARQLVRRLPQGEDRIAQITSLYVDEQYAPPPELAMEVDRANTFARQAWEVLRPAVMKSIALHWVKRLLPTRRPDFKLQ